MSKKIRVLLLGGFVIFFFLLAPQIIIYSLGYRFDFERKKIVNTGGLYLKIWPKRTEIFIDGEFRDKTGLFSNSVFIQNLLPKKHDILVKKEGYHVWQKTLEIKGKEVTKVENIILIKENPVFTIFQDTIDDFFFSLDGENIILKKLDKGNINFEVFNLKKENQKKISSLPFQDGKLLNLKWSLDSQKVLMKIETNEKIEYFVLESLIPTQPSLSPLKLLDENTHEVYFNPQNSEELFFIKNNSLYLENIDKIGRIVPVLDNLIVYEVSENNIVWLADSGFLYRSDFSGNIIEVFNVKPFPVKKNESYKITIHSETILLSENEILFVLNLDSKVFEKFSAPVKNFESSPNSNKIIYFNDYEVWFSDLISPKFEKIFLTRFSEKIEDCFWLNPHHVICDTGDKIKISEIDNRDRINIVNLAEFKNPKMFWNQNNKKLYILTENTLLVSEELIP